jgi:DNA-directed RNA polymerase specialized sigma24 family protein
MLPQLGQDRVRPWLALRPLDNTSRVLAVSMTEDWWRAIDDPLDRYERAGREQRSAEALVTRLTDLRARCLAELHIDGWSYARIGQATGLSRSRVQQLVERGGNVIP